MLDENIEEPITKQAFSKARHNILPKAFETLFLMTAQEALNNNELHCFKGYRVFAVDGTELELTRSAELSIKFPPSRHTTAPRASVSVLCDVLNGCIVHTDIKSLATDERTMARNHIEFYKSNKTTNYNGLFIFDRGYPSKDLIQWLCENKIKFLMRLQKSFSTEIDKPSKEDFYVNFCCNGTITKVHVIKLILPNGEQEILITNLGCSKFKKAEFLKLYFMRWGVETKYNSIKNKLLTKPPPPGRQWV